MCSLYAVPIVPMVCVLTSFDRHKGPQNIQNSAWLWFRQRVAFLRINSHQSEASTIAAPQARLCIPSHLLRTKRSKTKSGNMWQKRHKGLSKSIKSNTSKVVVVACPILFVTNTLWFRGVASQSNVQSCRWAARLISVVEQLLWQILVSSYFILLLQLLLLDLKIQASEFQKACLFRSCSPPMLLSAVKPIQHAQSLGAWNLKTCVTLERRHILQRCDTSTQALTPNHHHLDPLELQQLSFHLGEAWFTWCSMDLYHNDARSTRFIWVRHWVCTYVYYILFSLGCWGPKHIPNGFKMWSCR